MAEQKKQNKESKTVFLKDSFNGMNKLKQGGDKGKGTTTITNKKDK